MFFIKMNLVFFIFFTLETFLISISANGARLAMKVVESPVAHGFNNELISATNNLESLTTSVTPRNFSGPEQLRTLVGKCFNLTNEQYQYIFCPFYNVSQIELSSRWNAYHGILGVWQEWKIINNTFISMMMLKGDVCGSMERSVEISLECGKNDGIKDVSEPSKCQYHMVFETRLVCHRDSLLVYPRLPLLLQTKWDELETDLARADVTQKGYIEGLKRILVAAGFQLPPNATSSAINVDNDKHEANKTVFNQQCLVEVEELKKEIDALKLLLELNTMPS